MKCSCHQVALHFLLWRYTRFYHLFIHSNRWQIWTTETDLRPLDYTLHTWPSGTRLLTSRNGAKLSARDRSREYVNEEQKQYYGYLQYFCFPHPKKSSLTYPQSGAGHHLTSGSTTSALRSINSSYFETRFGSKLRNWRTSSGCSGSAQTGHGMSVLLSVISIVR